MTFQIASCCFSSDKNGNLATSSQFFIGNKAQSIPEGIQGHKLTKTSCESEKKKKFQSPVWVDLSSQPFNWEETTRYLHDTSNKYFKIDFFCLLWSHTFQNCNVQLSSYST